MNSGKAITVRSYGRGGPLVAVVHGGPGAAGYMKPVAEVLAREFRVLEPLQRQSGGAPLSVAGHVADMEKALGMHAGEEPVCVVGHSFGAMLALAHAAAHPERVARLVLVGCGTFDPAARSAYRAALAERMDADLEELIESARKSLDPDAQFVAVGKLVKPIYSFDLIPDADEEEPRCDSRGYRETWDDEIRLQAGGEHPAAFAKVRAETLMIHGADDPHPGRLVHQGLARVMPGIGYVELPRCGHYPWLERHGREPFYDILSAWLHGGASG